MSNELIEQQLNEMDLPQWARDVLSFIPFDTYSELFNPYDMDREQVLSILWDIKEGPAE